MILQGGEVGEEEENELFVNKPMLECTRVLLRFSDNEDSIEWIAIERQINCEGQIEENLRKIFREIKLENKCAQLLKENKDLIFSFHLPPVFLSLFHWMPNERCRLYLI